MSYNDSDPMEPKVSIITFDHAEILYSSETQTIFSLLKTTTKQSEVRSAED